MIALKVLLFSKIQHLTLTKCCVIFKFSTLQSVDFKANFKHFGRASSVGEIIFECVELCTGETKHIRI